MYLMLSQLALLLHDNVAHYHEIYTETSKEFNLGVS